MSCVIPIYNSPGGARCLPWLAVQLSLRKDWKSLTPSVEHHFCRSRCIAAGCPMHIHWCTGTHWNWSHLLHTGPISSAIINRVVYFFFSRAIRTQVSRGLHECVATHACTLTKCSFSAFVCKHTSNVSVVSLKISTYGFSMSKWKAGVSSRLVLAHRAPVWT